MAKNKEIITIIDKLVDNAITKYGLESKKNNTNCKKCRKIKNKL